MDKPKKLNIIGGGVAGLSAGIYARLNGFDTTIFESNPTAGGVCTSWNNEGYYVNGSIHWLVGSAPGIDFYDMWNDLGVINDNKFHYHTCLMECKNIDGVDVHFYLDSVKLKRHLLEISPLDAGLISEFIDGIRIMSKANLRMERAFELLHAWDWSKTFIGHFPEVEILGKFNQLSIREFAKKFKSEILRKAFESIWSPDMSMGFFLIHMGYAISGVTGYPLGGSGKFTASLVKRYIDLGGKFRFKQKVSKILITKNQAIGIQTEDGNKHHCDYVISACDGHTVLFKMLEGNYSDEITKNAYRYLKTYPSLYYFSAGVNRQFKTLNPAIIGLNLPLLNSLKVGDFEHKRVSFQIYNFDPTLSPTGKTLITAMLDTNYDFWKNLLATGFDKYNSEKNRINEELLQCLEMEFHGISELVEFSDSSTPITFEKWTGNHKGSYEGWLPTPQSTKSKISNHFKDLSNFYMSGHWVIPGGGLPSAAFSGREVIDLICMKEGQEFLP
ncbi:phytoene desaturase family protein [Shivajiella indica]|uniref:Phytoene desaturase family protein n=2 Tax=Shivajiella indica TaxID=872115 RepID=A0ABW5BF88_9BACT